MLEELIKDQEIQEFLHIFPQEHWSRCIYLSILYGIQKIKHEYSYPKLSEIESIINKQRKNTYINRIPTKNLEAYENKISKRNKISSSISEDIKDANLESIKRLKSPNVTSSCNKKSKIVPKYLKNVKSKIKEDVKKDLALHTYKKELLNSPRYVNSLRTFPNLLEVKEPNVCSIETFHFKTRELGMAKIAEKFLDNPYTKFFYPT